MPVRASGWLRHFLLLRWTELNETWRPLPGLCFSGLSERQHGRSGLWLAETFSTSPLNGIKWNLTGSIYLKFLYKVCVFGRMGKTRWPPRPLICRHISNSPLQPLNGIQWNLTESEILTSSTTFFFFWGGGGGGRKNKIASQASDYPRNFRLLLCNCWMEFNETWHEARSQRPLPSLCFGADQSKRWHIVHRCTICGHLGPLFPNLGQSTDKSDMYLDNQNGSIHRNACVACETQFNVWLPRKCDYQTDTWTTGCKTKWSPCAAMLRMRYINIWCKFSECSTPLCCKFNNFTGRIDHWDTHIFGRIAKQSRLMDWWCPSVCPSVRQHFG